MSEWISVRDRLPNKEGLYLVALPCINHPVIAQFSTWLGVNVWVNGNGFEGVQITHWMHLPPLPDAQQEEEEPKQA